MRCSGAGLRCAQKTTARNYHAGLCLAATLHWISSSTGKIAA